MVNQDHLLSCHLGGYTNMRHTRLRDLIAKMLKEVCYDVRTEVDKIQDYTNKSTVL